MKVDNGALPTCESELAAFHAAFARELAGAVARLPLDPGMRVLDVGCGDGFYTALLAARLAQPGCVVGFDSSDAMLQLAADRDELRSAACRVEFVRGDIDQLADRCADFDVVWCAQSLFSLPDPVAALGQMWQALRPGGLVAVLENDTLHQLLLPWPTQLEIALRAAEYAALEDDSAQPSKFYIGRRLPAVLADAGFEPLGFETHSIDRQAPLDPALEKFLGLYLNRLAKRVASRIKPDHVRMLQALIAPVSPQCLLRQPQFTMSWINVLAWGRRPLVAGH